MLNSIINHKAGKVTAQFAESFVGGEIRIRRGKDYCFQGGIKSIVVQNGPPKRIVVIVNWLAQRVRPVFFDKKGPLGELDERGWLLHPCGEGYEMPVDFSKVDVIKDGAKKSLVVLGFDGERVRFIPPGDRLCIAEKIKPSGV